MELSTSLENLKIKIAASLQMVQCNHLMKRTRLTQLTMPPMPLTRLPVKKTQNAKGQMYFHLQYDPEDPPAKTIQNLWCKFVAQPPGNMPLPMMTNWESNTCDITKLIVAYNKPPNLRNIFSIRDIIGRGGQCLSTCQDKKSPPLLFGG